MNHREVKALMLKDPEVKREYEALQVVYDIQRELIRLRIEQGLSQKELAERIGTRQSAVSRIERGECNPSVALLSKIAKALDRELQVRFT